MNSAEAQPIQAVSWSLGDAARGIGLVLGGTVLVGLSAWLAALLLDGYNAALILLFSLVLEGVLFLAVWRFGPWKYGQSWKALGLRASLNNGAALALMVFLAILSFNILYAMVTALLGLDLLTPPGLPGEIMEGYLQRLVGFLVTVLLAPVAEEVFFRGFLLPVMASKWGFLLGASAVSFLFAIIHAAPGLLVPAFVSGMLLAWLYNRTGSLWNCCLAHGAQNALAFTVVVIAP